jgi:hypothetical protein
MTMGVYAGKEVLEAKLACVEAVRLAHLASQRAPHRAIA